MILLGYAILRKPPWAFMAEHFFIYCAFRLQPVIKRAWLNWPPSQPVEMWERDFVTQAIIFLRLDHLPFFIGVIAKAARIKFTHRDIGRAMHHPPGQFAGQPGAPANADLGATTTPVIFHPWCRANQWVAIGWMRNSTMHFTLDAQFGKDRHAVQRIFQPWHDAVVVCLKQLILGFPGAMIFPHCVWIGLFIDSNQAGFLLHANIA